MPASVEGLPLSVEFEDLYKYPVDPALCRTDHELRGSALFGGCMYDLRSVRPFRGRDDGRRVINISSFELFGGEILELDGQIVAVDIIEEPPFDVLGTTDQQRVDAVRLMLRTMRWNVWGFNG